MNPLKLIRSHKGESARRVLLPASLQPKVFDEDVIFVLVDFPFDQLLVVVITIFDLQQLANEHSLMLQDTVIQGSDQPVHVPIHQQNHYYADEGVDERQHCRDGTDVEQHQPHQREQQERHYRWQCERSPDGQQTSHR